MDDWFFSGRLLWQRDNRIRGLIEVLPELFKDLEVVTLCGITLCAIAVLCLSFRLLRTPCAQRPILRILITGAASGLGRCLAQQLQLDGHEVFAVDVNQCIEAQSDNKWGKSATTNLTSKEPILNCQTSHKQKANFPIKSKMIDLSHPSASLEIQSFIVNPVDVLICSAGVFTMGAIADLEDSQITKSFQVNLFGVWRAVKAVLDLQRETAVTSDRAALGHRPSIFIVSTEGTRLTHSPYTWPYLGSKRALEDMADTLRKEATPLCRSVTIVRPGAMRTPMLDELRKSCDNKDIDPLARKTRKLAHAFAKLSSLSPEEVAGRLCRVIARIDRRLPPHELNIGFNPILGVASILPDRMVNFIQGLVLSWLS